MKTTLAAGKLHSEDGRGELPAIEPAGQTDIGHQQVDRRGTLHEAQGGIGIAHSGDLEAQPAQRVGDELAEPC
ncbi:MAG: hypothetical protein U1E60_08975 [Reyranellaceae bacterium]